jgi:hypothetical protein
MQIIRLYTYLLILAFSASTAVHAFSLRQVASLPIDGEAQVYGRSGGNIIIVEDNRLRFLNRRWQPRSEITLDSNQSVAISPTGQFYALIEKSVSTDSQSTQITAVVYNNRQVPLWGCVILREGEYFLSPEGDYLVAVCGTPGWYDFKMQLYHREKELSEFDIQSFSELVFSRQGRFLLINSAAKGVWLFDQSGRMLSQYKSQKKITISDDGKLVGLYDHKGKFMIYENEAVKLEVDLKTLTIKEMTLRNDVGRVAIAFHNLMQVLRTDDGSIIWKYSPGRKGGRFMTTDISPDGKYVACGVDINYGTSTEQHKRHVQGYLYVYDINGQTLLEHKFRYKNYSLGLPKVWFMRDNRTIMVRNKESLHFIEMY